MFKKVNVYELGYNPFQEIGKEWTLITAKNPEGKVNTMTASWGMQGILWGKPAVTVYIRQTRYTKEFVDAQDYFTVSLFDGNAYRKQLTILGRTSGRDTDKIKDVNFHVVDLDGQPGFEEAKCVFVCKKMYQDDIKLEDMSEEVRNAHYKDSDYHTMYIAEIVAAYVNE